MHPRDGAEGRLLLAAARSAVAPRPPPAPLPAGVDAGRLLRLAARNGLVPLLHRFASTARLPPHLSRPLAAAAGGNARDALVLAGRLRLLADAFGAAGVRVAAYKGPALAVCAYGDLALRTCSDLDLLVAPDDAPAAAAVLEAAGYRPYHVLAPAAERLFRRVDGDYPFHHPATGALVELHTRVSSLRFGAGLATSALLDRARPVRLGGGEVPALASDDLFVALALHGAKHRWARLEWLSAAGALAVQTGLALEGMVERAAEAGARRSMLLALLLLRRELGLALPAPVERALGAEAGLLPLADEARGLWFGAEATEASTTAANLRFNLRLQDGPGARARFAARWLLVPSPEDWAWVRLPAPLSPLYRLLRPLRLAMRYGPGGRG